MSDQEWDGGRLREFSPHWAERVIFLDECESTNDEARKLGHGGLASESLILTEKQTAGRGRRGQAWTCPLGESIACSLIVRPSEALVLWPRLSLAAGLAVAEALDQFGVSAEVKWPNDVWIQEKKVCGILLESDPSFAIIGIGVNVNIIDFPEGLAYPATSLALETGGSICREEVLVSILERLSIRTRQIGASFPELLQTWNTRCVLRGKRITLQTNGGSKQGVMDGVSPNGELLLKTESGIERILHADTIRLA
ncbi:biotin--[acetyl-CoA-carboxylase] ligase [Akkermansiaceae bacterium]|nr:biotin--[acetyl-CoA-carboxylase] ligase [Akkermansiaceae bacterium]